jgi:urocanate hydratase
LALEPQSSAAFGFIAQAAQAYASLIESTAADRETGLGGKFFYAGELDEAGRGLVVAANIAGAATLVATADRSAQKRAIHDGIADFLVTSLEEALRILKNQLRKRETVAVCVGLAPEAMEREMQARGAQPDLLRPDAAAGQARAAHRREAATGTDAGRLKFPALLTWSVASAPAQWLPQLDAIALDCLDEGAWEARRWLRMAPRFLGRLAHGLRLLRCEREVAARFIERVRERVERREIRVPVEIQTSFKGRREEHRLTPGESAQAS